MASVNIQKLHGSEAGAVLAHDYRHDGKDVAYRNEHVNPELSKNNGELYYRDVHAKGGKAHDEYQRLRRRVEEIDAKEPPKRIRSDRVTMVAFEVPVPAGLPADKENAFFKLAYKEIVRMCGGSRNVSPLKIHRDEIHDYLDPVTKEVKTSRVHGQCVGIPYVKGKGVNCKAFTARQRLRDIQQAIDRRCREELGVAFMDGTGQKSRGSVEDLKRYSAQAVAAQERHIADLQAQTAKSTQEAQKAQEAALNARTELNKAKDERDEVREDVEDARRTFAGVCANIREGAAKRDAIRREIDSEQSRLDVLKTSVEMLSAAEVAQIPEGVKMPLFGLLGRDNVLIPRQTLDKLVKTAEFADKAGREAVELSANRRAIERKAKADAQRLLEQERTKGQREARAIVDQAREEAGGYYELRRELDHYHRLEERYPEHFEAMEQADREWRELERERDEWWRSGP